MAAPFQPAVTGLAISGGNLVATLADGTTSTMSLPTSTAAAATASSTTYTASTQTTSYARPLTDVVGEVVHVVSFVPAGTAISSVTDWGPIWNAALNECRAINGADKQFRLIGPGCDQVVQTTINMTDLGYGEAGGNPFGSQIDFNNGRILGQTAGAAVIDAMNTWFLRISNLSLFASMTTGQLPTIGFQHGRAITNSNADTIQFDNCFFTGYFTLTSYYNLASESLSFLSGWISNGCPAAQATGVVSVGNNTSGTAPTPVSGAAKVCYSVILDGLNHWQVPTLSKLPTQSGNTPFPPETLVSFEQSTFLNVTISNNNGPALWMSHCASPRFIRCYGNSGAGQSLVDIYRTQNDDFVDADFDFHFETFGTLTESFTVASAVASGSNAIALTTAPSPPYFGTVSVSGTNIPNNTTATFTGTNLTLSAATTGAIASGATITITGADPTLYIFRLLGPAYQFNFAGGFSFRDSGTYAALSVFKLAGSQTSPTVNFQDIDIKLQKVLNGATNSTTATLFDTPASYTSNGDITCPAAVYNGVNHTGRLNLDGVVSEVGNTLFSAILSNASATAAFSQLGVQILSDTVQSLNLTSGGNYYTQTGTAVPVTVTFPTPPGGTAATASLTLAGQSVGFVNAGGTGYTTANGVALKDSTGATCPFTCNIVASGGAIQSVTYGSTVTPFNTVPPGNYVPQQSGASGGGVAFDFYIASITLTSGGNGYQAYQGVVTPTFSGATGFAATGTVTMGAAIAVTSSKVAPVLTAALPAASSAIEGTFAAVTDATSSTPGAALAGGGTNHVPVYCNGTSWTVR